MDSSREDRLASIRRRNKTLIIILFSLIISLALIIGGIVISFFLEYNLNSQSPNLNPAVKEFCSASESRLNCTTSLSSSIKTTRHTDPTLVYVLSLEAAVQKLSYIESIISRSNSNETRIDSALKNCWSSLRVAVRGLDGTLAVMRVNPDIGTRTFEQRRSMVLQIEKAMEVLRSCGKDMEKIGDGKEGRGSTVVDEAGARVYEVEVLLSNSRHFLQSFEWVNGNFQANANWSTKRILEDVATVNLTKRILEDVATVNLFGLQYFVLIFLFCLLLRRSKS